MSILLLNVFFSICILFGCLRILLFFLKHVVWIYNVALVCFRFCEILFVCKLLNLCRITNLGVL